MSLNKKIENIEDKILAALFHPHETIYERHAREQQSKKFLGEGLERLVTVYVPGVLGYKFIKEARERKVLTEKSSLQRKLMLYSIAVGTELVVNGIKAGLAYGIYELISNFPQ